MSRALHLGLALALVSGCGLSQERNRRDDGGVDAFVAPEDAGTDAFVPEDSGADAGVDAFVPDAFVPEPDGGPPCECVATSECESAACVDGVCVRGPVSDGAECGELVMGMPSGVCVEGACRLRGCGDGFVEPGPTGDDPTAPPREACDDGNLVDDDACSSVCEPNAVVVDVSEAGDWSPELGTGQPRSVAVDGAGRVLVVYQRRTSGTLGPVLGQRFDAGGVRVGEPLMLGAARVFPSVVGLPSGGWVVAYDGIQDFLTVAVFRHVAVDGSMGPIRRAGVGTERDEWDARVGPHGDGFIVTFKRETMFEQRLFARRFSAAGTPLEAELLVHVAADVRHANVATEGEGDDRRWIVVWQDDFTSPRAMARRYRESTALDATAFEIASSAREPYVVSGLAPGATPSTEPGRVRWLVATHDGTVAVHPITAGARDTFPSTITFPPPARGEDGRVTLAPRSGAVDASAPPLLVAYLSEIGTVQRRARVAATVALPVDELLRLDDALMNARAGVALAPSARGTWLAWAESGIGTPIRLFLLPN
jgi:cysteine-rich repeat protein